MMLVNHGGMCCGIKHIFGFGNDPSSKEPARTEVAFNDDDAYGRYVASSQSFFTDAAPAETRLERFNRYIEFVKKTRPKHIIEVVLVPKDQGEWPPLLEERGFRIVNTFLNSNSSNTCVVYHLLIDEPWWEDDDEDEDCETW